MNLDDITVLERRHKGTFMCHDNTPVDIDVSVALEFQRNPSRCHMVVVNRGGYFVNTAFNICNWPVETWNLHRVREFLRVFEEEYVPMCAHWSELASDVKYPPTKNVFHISNTRSDEPDSEGYYDLISSKTTDIKSPVSDEDDVALLIWQKLDSDLECSNRTVPCDADDNEYSYTWRLDETFGVCEFMVDIDYEEAIFPFQDASNDMKNIIKDHLKTLWELSLTSVSDGAHLCAKHCQQ